MTLLNKKYNKNNVSEYVTEFPIKNLDKSNNPYKEDLVFSFFLIINSSIKFEILSQYQFFY